MEVIDIVSYYIFEDSKEIEVYFKMNVDNEDEIRTDLIDIEEFTNYGYNVIENDFDDFFSDDPENSEENFDDFIYINEEIFINFLNEYYIVNPKKLPKKILI